MSIISEALQKAQKQKNQQYTSPNQDRPALGKGLFLTIILVLAVALPFTLPQVLSNKTTNQSTDTPGLILLSDADLYDASEEEAYVEEEDAWFEEEEDLDVGSAQIAVETQLINQIPIQQSLITPTPRYTLSGIANDQSGWLAIVNGEVVQEGDVLGDVKVSTITNTQVILLDKNNEEIVITA